MPELQADGIEPDTLGLFTGTEFVVSTQSRALPFQSRKELGMPYQRRGEGARRQGRGRNRRRRPVYGAGRGVAPRVEQTAPIAY